MNKVKQALIRKIGPLPAWVYLLVFAAAAYWWQNRKGKGQTVLTPANQPGVMDSQTPQDIVPLQPGESAYNPNTGQLVATAPEQFPPNPPADRPQPITLQPGETIYDPATGQLIGGPPPAAPAAPKAPAKPKPSFFLRSGVTLDKGNKLVKGAHAHYHGKAGTLGPTGGFHPLAAVKKRVAKPKPKPKAPKKAAPQHKAKARSAAALPAAHPRVSAPVKTAPPALKRSAHPAAAKPVTRAAVAQHAAPRPVAHHAPPPPPPPRRRPPPPPPRRRR